MGKDGGHVDTFNKVIVEIEGISEAVDNPVIRFAGFGTLDAGPYFVSSDVQQCMPHCVSNECGDEGRVVIDMEKGSKQGELLLEDMAKGLLVSLARQEKMDENSRRHESR